MATAEEINALLLAVPEGNAAAFEQLYAATCAKLYGVVLRILRRHDLSAEVLEAAYLQIWSTASEFDPRLFSATAWMVAIARRRAIDRARQSQADPVTAKPRSTTMTARARCRGVRLPTS